MFILILMGDVSSICDIPCGMALFSIGELLVIGVAFRCCIFSTALSLFGVEILDVKFFGISGLLSEVI